MDHRIQALREQLTEETHKINQETEKIAEEYRRMNDGKNSVMNRMIEDACQMVYYKSAMKRDAAMRKAFLKAGRIVMNEM